MSKIIISDTSCLIALSKIQKLHLLKDLFEEIIITEEVYEEFRGSLPKWISVYAVKNKLKQDDLEKQLDKGEASSIALALEYTNSTLIIDELKGRKIAKSYNISIIGTIGIILLANKKGEVEDVIGTILRLVNNGFRLSDKLLNLIIEKYGKS